MACLGRGGSAGADLNERNKWDAKVIDTFSHDIRSAFPGIKGFSPRSLKYMQKFAREVDAELCSGCCTIPWGHIMKLLDKIEPGEKREWYRAAIVENKSLSFIGPS